MSVLSSCIQCDHHPYIGWSWAICKRIVCLLFYVMFSLLVFSCAEITGPGAQNRRHNIYPGQNEQGAVSSKQSHRRTAWQPCHPVARAECQLARSQKGDCEDYQIEISTRNGGKQRQRKGRGKRRGKGLWYGACSTSSSFKWADSVGKAGISIKREYKQLNW